MFFPFYIYIHLSTRLDKLSSYLNIYALYYYYKCVYNWFMSNLSLTPMYLLQIQINNSLISSFFFSIQK